MQDANRSDVVGDKFQDREIGISIIDEDIGVGEQDLNSRPHLRRPVGGAFSHVFARDP